MSAPVCRCHARPRTWQDRLRRWSKVVLQAVLESLVALSLGSRSGSSWAPALVGAAVAALLVAAIPEPARSAGDEVGAVRAEESRATASAPGPDEPAVSCQNGQGW